MTNNKFNDTQTIKTFELKSKREIFSKSTFKNRKKTQNKTIKSFDDTKIFVKTKMIIIVNESFVKLFLKFAINKEKN